MGLRGRGAGTRLLAAKKVASRKNAKKLPWNAEGLSRVDRVIAFLEFLPVTKGHLVGSRMKLLPDQLAFVQELYGSSNVRIAIKSEPRGNGKTGLLAGLACCHLFGPEAEDRGEIDSAAIDRQMAGIMFNEMEAIINAVPEFCGRINIQRFVKRIEVVDGQGKGSTYDALSADARRAHGLAPSLWIYDELAQAKDRILLDNLQTAMGKRKRSLGVIISTQAPDDDHPLSQLIDDGLSGADPTVLVHLTCAPPEADPFDPATIRACNPAMGIFLSEGDIMAEAERARRIPAFEGAFRNLRLNQRADASQEARIVPAAVWKQGALKVRPEAQQRGRPAFGGLDLSGTTDLTALVVAVPDERPEPCFDIYCHFWSPEGQLEARPPVERDRFKEWARSGHLTLVPGKVIRYRYVAEALARLNAFYKFSLGFDRWGMNLLEPELEDIGLKGMDMEPIGQGYQDMSPAVNFLIEMAMTNRLRHGGNPVLTSCIANAVITTDAAGNRKIDKNKSNTRSVTRIDGAVALAEALIVAKRRGFGGKVNPVADFLFHAVSA